MIKMRNKPYMVIFLAVALFFSVNVIADYALRGIQIDLSEDRLYSVSDSSQEYIASIEGAITVEFYFSRALATPYPSLLSYGKRIETLLRGLADHSGGKMQVMITDPEPFSEAEDHAVTFGMKGIPVTASDMLYMGLRITNDVDGEVVLPFLSQEREKFIEYDVMKAISGLEQSDKPRLGLLTQLPMAMGAAGGIAAQPYVLYQQLADAYQVVNIASNFEKLPEQLDVLMVVHPPELTDKQTALLDDYIQDGGKTLIFTDPHAEAMTQSSAGQFAAALPNSSRLNGLLSTYGLQMLDGKVIGDAMLAQKVSMGEYTRAVKDYLLWLNVQKDQMDGQDIVTGHIDNLALASVGVLQIVEGPKTTVTPLITSSTEAMLMDASKATGLPDPDDLLRGLKVDGKAHIIAARVTGQGKNSKPLSLFFMADSDLFDDRFWIQTQSILGQQVAVPTSGNGAFVLGLVDQMTGNDVLLGLRARGVSNRPFTRVEAIRRVAEARYLAQEEALEDRLKAAEEQIQRLEAQQQNTDQVLLPGVARQSLNKFRAEVVETRRALRTVKRNLRQDIESLHHRLAVINILLLPFILALAGLYILWRRRQRADIH